MLRSCGMRSNQDRGYAAYRHTPLGWHGRHRDRTRFATRPGHRIYSKASSSIRHSTSAPAPATKCQLPQKIRAKDKLTKTKDAGNVATVCAGRVHSTD